MISILWHGTDGSQWDLVNGPVGLTAAGIRGLGMPLPEDQTRRTAVADGQYLTGWKLKEREVWLPLRFRREAATDVTGIQDAWWNSVALGETGTLEVIRPDGGVRRLGLRFKDDGGRTFPISPEIRSDPFGLTMVADRPWWEGEPIPFQFSLESGDSDFFSGGSAPPFIISPSSGSQAQTMTNPGDAPAWIDWTVEGPATAFQLGVDGHYVAGAFPVIDGDTLTIETDPLRQIALLNGTQRVTRQLSSVDWQPIPRRTTLPVTIQVTGSGLITATIVPRFARAL